MEWLPEIFKASPVATQAAQAARILAGGESPIEAFDDPARANEFTRSLQRGLPWSLVPVGTHEGQLIALDASLEVCIRGQLPVLRAQEDGFFHPIAFDLSRALSKAADKTDAVERAPSAMSARVDAALAANARGDAKREHRHWMNAMRRPPYTARSTDEIAQVQAAILQLDATIGVDPILKRMAEAGLEGERWRIIGAERAIANRIQDAVRAMQGAHFLGAPIELLAPTLQRIASRSGWGFVQRLLNHNQRWTG